MENLGIFREFEDIYILLLVEIPERVRTVNANVTGTHKKEKRWRFLKIELRKHESIRRTEMTNGKSKTEFQNLPDEKAPGKIYK